MSPASAARPPLPAAGVEGVLAALSPMPLMFAAIDVTAPLPPLWRMIVAALASLFCIATAIWLFKKPRAGTWFGGLWLSGGLAAAMPHLMHDPFSALLISAATLGMAWTFADIRAMASVRARRTKRQRARQRARGAAVAVTALAGFFALLGSPHHPLALAALATAPMIAVGLWARWSWLRFTTVPGRIVIALATPTVFAALALSVYTDYTLTMALVIGLLIVALLPRPISALERREHWWELLINHPARMLLSTFLALCVLGTILLSIPGAATGGGISLVDAAFTSVSAVCVTGLIVVDTPNAFSLFGQAGILLLIQLGGLGIMTITTVALHAMGRRLSLHQERVLSTMTDTGRQDLVASLITILRFTAIAELTGAVILTPLFYLAGDGAAMALWRGVFTAVSAFCNAGFALQSDSLIPYQNAPLILHTVAALIVLGGIAPATSLLIPRWLRRRPVPPAAHIALVTTAVLLVFGTVSILAFEWSGMLDGLSVADKLHNAWFQSVTLRTAGFNSVNIAHALSPTFVVMLSFMFIGGSPGGTAGGVKTTTIGLLALTFWATVTGRREVIIRHRRVPYPTVYRAVTIVLSGVTVWFLIILMLEVTQQISARDIIFEATSAMGTVGLSTGATGQLDGIGKIIIMIAMFTGRIGPMTLFTLLSADHAEPASRYPDAGISLT